MRTTPYARVPHAMVATFSLDTLSPGAERVFWRLYLLAARRKEPMLGYLVDQHQHPYSLRELGRICSIPRSTIHDNLPGLRAGGLVATDTTGAWYLPPVQQVERGFASRPHQTTTTGAGQLSFPISTAVENPGSDPPGVSALRTESSGLRTPLPSSSSRRPEDVRDVDEVTPVQNRMALTPGVWIDRVPPGLTSSDCGYLVAKLAASEPRWRSLIESPRDRVALEQLHDAHPSALHAALQQAADDPGAIRKPAAWLTSTARAIAGMAS